MHKKKFLSRLAVAAGFAALACGAHAQKAGSWFVTGGITNISPNTSSGTLSPPSAPGTTVDVGSDTEPTLSVGRMLTDHWSLELPISAGFTHDINGSGAIAGVGKIGSVKALPVTLFAQYRFLEPTSRFRPYAMLGLTYAYFYDAHGSATLNAINPANPPGGSTGLSVDSKWALTPGLGVTAMINDRWFVDAQYARSFLKTTTTLSTGQHIDTKLDPDMFRLAVGVFF